MVRCHSFQPLRTICGLIFASLGLIVAEICLYIPLLLVMVVALGFLCERGVSLGRSRSKLNLIYVPLMALK